MKICAKFQLIVDNRFCIWEQKIIVECQNTKSMELPTILKRSPLYFTYEYEKINIVLFVCVLCTRPWLRPLKIHDY